jgi:hypothetical protein
MFPGAEIVGYRNSDSSPDEKLFKNEDGLLVVQLPMQFQLARYLLESFATARAYQRELMRAQRRGEGIQDFFDAFVNTVESSSDITDRKLGMSLLINKILARVLEECICICLRGERHAAEFTVLKYKDIDLLSSTIAQSERSWAAAPRTSI